MAPQLHAACFHRIVRPPSPPLDPSFPVTRNTGNSIRYNPNPVTGEFHVAATGTLWKNWIPEKDSNVSSLSDVFWPSAGAFAAMAILGKIDQILAPKGVSITIAPLGAVCAVLFAAPSSPSARKYNVFVAHIGCALIGVLSYSAFGSGWLAKSIALASSLAFMIFMGALHPPAAGLPLLFIDGVKFHHLKLWYALFPSAAGCILLILIQETVCYLKEHFKF